MAYPVASTWMAVWVPSTQMITGSWYAGVKPGTAGGPAYSPSTDDGFACRRRRASYGSGDHR